MCSEKSLKAFAESVLDGTAEPEYKSAPIPDEPTDGGVVVVVGKNFDSIVKDADKDVLLEVGTAALFWLQHRSSMFPAPCKATIVCVAIWGIMGRMHLSRAWVLHLCSACRMHSRALSQLCTYLCSSEGAWHLVVHIAYLVPALVSSWWIQSDV